MPGSEDGKPQGEGEVVVIENAKVKMLNVFLVGLCFTGVFTGFNTMGQTQNLIYDGAESYIDGFSVDGLVTNGIVYGVFAFASWVAPSVVLKLGVKVSMIIAAAAYIFNIVQLFYLNPISIYIASGILGLMAPVIWVAQGTFLASNSDPSTITRNSGVFWSMNMSSAFIGNTLAFFLFKDEDSIGKDTKNTLAIVLTAVSAAGALLMLALRPTPWADKPKVTFVATLVDSWKLFLTPNMLIFCITMFFTGLNQSLWGGIYTTCVGFSLQLGTDTTSAKSLGAISGILVAAGEVLGGILFGFLGHLTVKRGRYPAIILAFVLSMVVYLLTFLNFPANATIDETTDDAPLGAPSVWIALLTSFLLGLSDACLMTQVTSILGDVFGDRTTSAFAIFKFVQSLASMIMFLLSGLAKIELHWQLLIIAIFDVLGTVACLKVEHTSRKKPGSLEM